MSRPPVSTSFSVGVNLEAFVFGIFSIMYLTSIWALVWRSSRPSPKLFDEASSPLSPNSAISSKPPSYKSYLGLDTMSSRRFNIFASNTHSRNPSDMSSHPRTFSPDLHGPPSFWARLRRTKTYGNTPPKLKFGLVATMTAMYLLAGTHWVVSVVRLTSASDVVPGGILMNISLTSLDITNSFLFVSSIIVGDMFAIYRCYVIWHRHWKIIALPIFLLVGTVLSGYGACVHLTVIRSSQELFSPATKAWISTALSIALCTSVLCTILTSYHIHTTQSPARSIIVSPGSSHSPVKNVIQSGAICALTLLAVLVTYLRQWGAGWVFWQCLPSLIGVTFCAVSGGVRSGLIPLIHPRQRLQPQTDIEAAGCDCQSDQATLKAQQSKSSFSSCKKTANADIVTTQEHNQHHLAVPRGGRDSAVSTASSRFMITPYPLSLSIPGTTARAATQSDESFCSPQLPPDLSSDAKPWGMQEKNEDENETRTMSTFVVSANPSLKPLPRVVTAITTSESFLIRPVIEVSSMPFSPMSIDHPFSSSFSPGGSSSVFHSPFSPYFPASSPSPSPSPAPSSFSSVSSPISSSSTSTTLYSPSSFRTIHNEPSSLTLHSDPGSHSLSSYASSSTLRSGWTDDDGSYGALRLLKNTSSKLQRALRKAVSTPTLNSGATSTESHQSPHNAVVKRKELQEELSTVPCADGLYYPVELAFGPARVSSIMFPENVSSHGEDGGEDAGYALPRVSQSKEQSLTDGLRPWLRDDGDSVFKSTASLPRSSAEV